jgi:hypothetical protein
MVEIRIEADKAILEVQGWDKLWSLRSHLEILLSHAGFENGDLALGIREEHQHPKWQGKIRRPWI